MKKITVSLFLLTGFFLFITNNASAYKADKRSYYEIKLYHVSTDEQVQQVDHFLETAYLPALHRTGIPKIGVYHWAGNDTSADKRIYVFIPLRSLEDMNTVEELMLKDKELQASGDAYWNVAFDATPFKRIETIVLKAFPMMPKFQVPALTGNKTSRVYELRSYEGPTERLYRQKVDMFNNAGEVDLFKRLNFNAVFYGEVLSGSRMPNLMYMTSFTNQADRDEHWKKFSSDPVWVGIKDLPQYLHTVSRNETLFLHPTEFSEI